MIKKMGLLASFFLLLLFGGLIVLKTTDDSKKSMREGGVREIEGATSVSSRGSQLSENSQEHVVQKKLRDAALIDIDTKIENRNFSASQLKKRISNNVLVATGLTEGKRYYPRAQAVRKLSKTLARNEVEALYVFLDEKFNDQDDLSLLAYNALKNDILNALHLQADIPNDLGSKLASMFRDGAHDDVWRDYCIQHLALHYESRWPDGSPADDNPDRVEIEKVYWEATEQTDKTFAGTALIGLEYLSQKYPEFDREKISQVAIGIVESEQSGEAATITALQICGQMDKPEALDGARVLAQTGKTTSIRMSAIAAIGYTGTQEDIELLNSLLASEEKRLHPAAKGAIKRLQAKFSKEDT